MTEAEMQTARTVALDEARAINTKAETENRDLNEAEKTLYGQKLVEVRSFDERIRRADETRAAALNPGQLRVAQKEVGDANLGLTDKEVRRFSIVKLMNALGNQNDAAAHRAAAFEFECSAEVQRKSGRDGGSLRGFTIPADVVGQGREERALTVGSAVGGGNTVATNLLAGNFVDILRNRMSVTLAGATMLADLVGFVAIPTQTAAATLSWVNEAAAPGAPTTQAFAQKGLNPHTGAAFVDISRRLLLQSSIDVEAFVRNDLARVMAIGIDYAALNGPGTGGSPLGILQTPGIGSVALGVNGASAGWNNIIALETAVASLNADVETSAYITNAKQRGALKNTAQLANTIGMPIWADNEVNGYRAICSNQVPSNLTKGTGTNLSAILFGNFADVYIGMWGGLDILLDPYTSSTTGTVRFVMLQDVDVTLRRLESFAAITDAQ